MKSYLNIASGRIKPIPYNTDPDAKFLVQLDKMYYSAPPPESTEVEHGMFNENFERFNGNICYCNIDAFEFLGLYKHQFDYVSCYRFLEHVKKTDIQGFIYLLSTALKIDGTLDIIVPNYETLADMILNEVISEETKHLDWERHNTTLTYELLNEPSMPHASIWTPQRIKYFFTLEERFEIISLDESYEFDGRNLYIRAILRRIK